MKEKNKIIFKKPTVLATLKIPTPDEIPYSPSYKRLVFKSGPQFYVFSSGKLPDACHWIWSI